MKKLKVSLDEIGKYMQNQNRYDMDFYLDKETGKIIIMETEILRKLEDGKITEDSPDWQDEEIKIAENILRSGSERYIRIPEKPSYEGYNLMVEFADEVEDKSLREKLAIALDGKGAFRRFKNVLSNYPEYRQKWFDFEQEKMDEEVIEWLNSIDIEPEISNDNMSTSHDNG